MRDIRDPHHRQMRRLAKMRAISTVVATSDANVKSSQVKSATSDRKQENIQSISCQTISY